MGSCLQKPDNTYTDIETVSMSNSFRRVTPWFETHSIMY